MINQEIKTFGRRHGKKLSARQQYLIDNLLPKLSPVGAQKCALARQTTMSASSPRAQKCAPTNPVILEIGFGKGENLMKIARENPGTTIIGAEPFINGVASLLSQIIDTRYQILDTYKNIRIWPDDVRTLLSSISYLISTIYVLHPDPWPKARHEKRRLLTAEFLNLLESHLAPNGQIIIGTDHHEYFDWIVEQVKDTKLAISKEQLAIIETRYQQKNMAGTDAPKYLVLTRVS